MEQRRTELLELHKLLPRQRGEAVVDPLAAGGRTGRTPRPVTAQRVLVVERSAKDAETLVCALRRQGCSVQSVTTGGEALQSYGDVDLVLIDLELPDLDGLEVCRGIRSTCDVPVIIVTARGSELDRVLGLQAGADDYLVKPYGFRELMARVEAVMRRSQTQEPLIRSISHGPLRIDAGTRKVTLHDRRIELTRKEFDLLYLLASEPDTVIPRKRLIHQVWGDSWSRRTVDTHVSSLRNKLGNRNWVVTVRGVGFSFGRGD